MANNDKITDNSLILPPGRIIALDPGTKQIGLAVTDEHRLLSRPLPFIARTSWKKLLLSVKDIVEEFDAKALIIGLPVNSDGSESEMSAEARRLANNFALSLDIPVFLQDERTSSYEAKRRLWEQGIELSETKKLVDSEAAVIILSDFLDLLRSGKVSLKQSVD